MENLVDKIEQCRRSFIESSGGRLPTEIRMSNSFFMQLADDVFSYTTTLDNSKDKEIKESFIKATDSTIFGMAIIKDDSTPLLNFYIN